MVSQQEWAEIYKLRQAGISVPKISLRFGRTTKTVYRLVKSGGPKIPEKLNREIPEKLIKYKNYLDLRIRRGVHNASKLHEELRQQGFTGSYYLVNTYIRTKTHNIGNRRRAHKNYFLNKFPRSEYKRGIRFETEPGQQAQVDWGYFGKIEINGRLERLYCFVYILGYSRVKYIEFTVKQNSRTLIHCHNHAFEKLGIPKEIVYDNMKTVVSKRFRLQDGTSNTQLNPLLVDFSKYYSFEIKPTAPYWPRAKGKVERAIRFIRGNFMQGIRIGKGLKSLEELNEKAKSWLDTVANIKLNETTGEKPIDRWNYEKPYLGFPNSLPTYDVSGFHIRFSSKDGSVEFKSCAYPVPQEYARRSLVVKEIDHYGVSMIEIYYVGEMIAKYYVSLERHKWINENGAIFFKNSLKKKIPMKVYSRITKVKGRYPSISPRHISYYNQVIKTRKVRKEK